MKAIKDSVIYLIGELISKAMPFLLLPYLSRKLGVEGFGELSYYQTFIALFFLVISLSQDGAVTRYFYFYGKRSLNLIVSTGYIFSLFTGSIILLICFLIKSEILAYCALSAIFQSFLSVQLGIRQCQKQAVPYTIIQFLSGLISVLFTIILLELFTANLVEKRILAIFFANLVVFLISYFLYKGKIRYKRFSISRYKTALLYLLAFGIPLVFHNLSHFLKGQLDRIFIYHQFSELDLGLYAMGAQVAAIFMVIIQAINKATVPYYFEGLKKQKIDIALVHKFALYSLCLVPIPALLFWFIPESLVLWILGSNFGGVKYYISCFLLSNSLIIPYLILVNYLFYFGKNKLIALCSILSTVVYLLALVALMFTQIEYIPFASILGALAIIPILFYMTKKVSQQI